jgi:hypothetical protein
VQATNANGGNPRPCVFKGCQGTMSYTLSAHEPGTRAIARMSDGTLKTVGTVRPGWLCDRHPDHMQTEGCSGSEVVRSRM